jgi:hypothetical protein
MTEHGDRNDERQASKNKAFVLRLPESLYAELESWAAHDLRSVNSLIVLVLREAVKRRDEEYTEEQQNAEILEAA